MRRTANPIHFMFACLSEEQPPSTRPARATRYCRHHLLPVASRRALPAAPTGADFGFHVKVRRADVKRAQPGQSCRVLATLLHAITCRNLCILSCGIGRVELDWSCICLRKGRAVALVPKLCLGAHPGDKLSLRSAGKGHSKKNRVSRSLAFPNGIRARGVSGSRCPNIGYKSAETFAVACRSGKMRE